eukprot:8231928-Pyramimonas_sp.AAC.1
MPALAFAHRARFGTPLHAFRGPRGSSTECGAHNGTTHTCIWLGLSLGYFFWWGADPRLTIELVGPRKRLTL